MLHLEADPLDEASSSRFRLRLRDGDDAFFRENIVEVRTHRPLSRTFVGVVGAKE